MSKRFGVLLGHYEVKKASLEVNELMGNQDQRLQPKVAERYPSKPPQTAQQANQRAEQLAARLRALGIDPDEG